MRMMDKKWDNELYQGDCCEELYDEINIECNIDGNYNDDKEQYRSDYWNYVNNGGEYDE